MQCLMKCLIDMHIPYIHIHICIHTHICIHIFTYIYAYTYIYAHPSKAR